jgi:2-keto-4-pentenoate hydratase/2-oxohepta-3-ene-1,7-dioic acid hydratase in catechol pathway
VDGEQELAVVIGASAYNVDCVGAMDYVFGFTVANDVSARDLQFGDGQGSGAKASTRSAPSCRRSCRAAMSPIRTTCASYSA